MIGMKIVPNDKIKDSREFVSKMREKKLLAAPAAENVVRILPPLIIEKSHVDEAIEILKSLCQEIDSYA